MIQAQRKPGRFGGGVRVAAILAAMSPVVAGIYQESQESRQRQTQRHDEEEARQNQVATAAKEDVNRRRNAEIEADKTTALALQDALATAQRSAGSERTAATAQEFCSRLFFTATQLTNQNVSTRTRAILYAALRLRDPDDAGSLRACQCSGKPGSAVWLTELQQMIPPDEKSGSDRLSLAVRSALDECTSDPSVSPQQALIEQLQQKVAALTAERDLLTVALKNGAPLSTGSEAGGTSGEVVGGDPGPSSAAPHPAASAPLPCLVDTPADSRRLRVFIQVPDAQARSDANKLRDAINASPPFKSPGIQTVGASRSPNDLQIRYTYPMDKPAVEIIQKAILSGSCGAGGAKPLLVYMGRYQGGTDTGVIELWWPRPLATTGGSP